MESKDKIPIPNDAQELLSFTCVWCLITVCPKLKIRLGVARLCSQGLHFSSDSASTALGRTGPVTYRYLSGYRQRKRNWSISSHCPRSQNKRGWGKWCRSHNWSCSNLEEETLWASNNNNKEKINETNASPYQTKEKKWIQERNLKEGLGGIKVNSSSGRADPSLCLLRRPKWNGHSCFSSDYFSHILRQPYEVMHTDLCRAKTWKEVKRGHRAQQVLLQSLATWSSLQQLLILSASYELGRKKHYLMRQGFLILLEMRNLRLRGVKSLVF